MKNDQSGITRRDTLRGFAGLMSAVKLAPRCYGQAALPVRSGLSAKLVYEFANAYLLAVCPNGTKICLYFTEHPERSLAFQGRGWKRVGETGRSAEELRIVEIRTGRSIYKSQLRDMAQQASFFADGQNLYAETLAFSDGSGLASQQILVDLQSGKQIENIRTEHHASSRTLYCALDNRMLLGAQYEPAGGGYTTLVHSTWPGDKIDRHVQFTLVAERDPIGHDTDVTISADRRKLVYGTDHFVACRNSEDLGLAWAHEIEHDYFGATRLALSSEGDWVAAAIVDTTFLEQQRRCHIQVYSGKDGTLASELPVNGDGGIAISPDGKRLAVGERVKLPDHPEQVELVVSVFDRITGLRIARVIHDRFRADREKSVNGHFGIHGIQFTSDGKYLITSSTRTKVWELVSDS
jgi:hypothetical protein